MRFKAFSELRYVGCFGIQMDKSVDVSVEAQLLVYWRFSTTNST